MMMTRKENEVYGEESRKMEMEMEMESAVGVRVELSGRAVSVVCMCETRQVACQDGNRAVQ